MSATQVPAWRCAHVTVEGAGIILLKRLVGESRRLIGEVAAKKPSLDRLIEDSLCNLLNPDKETNTV